MPSEAVSSEAMREDTVRGDAVREDAAPAVVDVTCLGESMVTFAPTAPGPLADVPGFARGIGGAESNVACALARSGHTARWVSRVGADGFGTHLTREIAAWGVDVSAVRRDPARPTGIYFRTAGERATTASTATTAVAAEPGATSGPLAEVAYYRHGSAASAMSPATVDVPLLGSTRVLHLTGITAALSDGCRDLLRTLAAPRPGRPLLSFDVNYRAPLWPHAAEAGRVLRDLARASDLVLVGDDEAEAAWGVTGDPRRVRAFLPEPDTLVVKQGALGATVFARTTPGGPDAVAYEPAPTVDVVAPVGAGDAFAAGFLAATLRGLPPAARLRHGHLGAAAALTSAADLAVPPSRALAGRFAALDAPAWAALRLSPGWTDAPAPAPAAAPAEVRGP